MASRQPDIDKLQDKWVCNLSSKLLNNAGKSLLQNSPKFAVSPSSIYDYITATKHICDSLGGNSLSKKTDCTEYYVKVKDFLSKFVAKHMPQHYQRIKESPSRP